MFILDDYTDAFKNGPYVATIGSFDGVHKGHRALLQQTVACALEKRAQSLVITLDPHPAIALGLCKAHEVVLSSNEQKAGLLRASNVDCLLSIRFDEVMVYTSAENFVRNVLVRHIGALHVLVGAGFRFGNRRVGNCNLLQTMGEELGFGVTVVELLEGEGGITYSSSSARRAVTNGNMELFRQIMGRDHSLRSSIEDITIFSGGYSLSLKSFGDVVVPGAGLYEANVSFDNARNATNARVRSNGCGDFTVYLLDSPPPGLRMVSMQFLRLLSTDSALAFDKCSIDDFMVHSL